MPLIWVDDLVPDDQRLADWVSYNFIPADPADQPSRARGISNRVLAVIRSIRAQYDITAEELAMVHTSRAVRAALQTKQRETT